MGPANDGLRFLLELAALAAVATWGFSTGGSAAARWGLAIGAVVVLAGVWALFVAPRASMRTTDPVRLVVELAVFGAAVVALVHAGHSRAALVLGAIVAVHLALTFPLEQR